MIKRSGFYMFVSVSPKNNLSVLHGGQLRKLSMPLQYYYDRLSEYGNTVLSSFSRYWDALYAVSDSIKSITSKPEDTKELLTAQHEHEQCFNRLLRRNTSSFDEWFEAKKPSFNGRVHGCIVDLDFYNHLFLNPFDGSSHCANLIVALPQEMFPLGESSKSPLHFAAHRDESVIAGYYTSGEVHLPPRHLPLSPERRDALWQEMMVLTAPLSEISPFRTRPLATPSSTMSVKRTAIETPTLSPSALHGTSISRNLPPATLTYLPNWKPLEPFPRAA